MKLVWFTDSGAFIQASVDDAWSSILTGIILTAVLLFLFLHEPRSTFIVMISMPISVVVTFAVMAYFNYSFNIMTLLSLGCSVGVLVTNSIVVIENIFKHLDRGEPIKTAAERGTGEVIGFLLFWGLNLWVVLRGAESIKWLETLSAPLLVLVGLGLLVWALPHISVSELLAQPPKRPEGASVTGYFMAGLTAMVGFWATLSLNIPDFSRYARSQKDQILGQIFGLPLTMFLFAALGVVMTAASASLVGETVSDPVSLIGHIPSPGWVAVAMALIIVATLSTNTAANIVSPTNDFQNIAPKLIGRTRAVWLTGFIGLALMAHELLKKLGWIVSDLSLESVYSNWLLGYSSLLGPIAGIMVVDYFLVRRQRLDLAGLYRDDVYPAWNWPGFAAFAVPVALTVMALGNRQFHWFYDYGWFTGSLLGGALYYGLCGRRARSPAALAKPLP